MLSLHALLLVFLFCSSAVAPPPRSANTPFLRPDMPNAAKGRYYRAIIAPNKTPVPKEYINDIMVLREDGEVELRQLTAAPGVLINGQVLSTTANLIRLQGDWIRFPTGDIRDKDYCEMVHVEVKSRFVVTCGTLVEEDNAWTEILLSQTTGYYYNAKALIEPLPSGQPEVLKEVLSVKPNKFQFWKMPVPLEMSSPTVDISMVQTERWIPFPVAIDDVQKLETRSRVYHLMQRGGQHVARFKPLEIGH